MTKDKAGLRGGQLSQLYARPKTYEERQQEKQRLDEIRLAQRPINPRVKIAAWGGLVFMLIALLVGNVGQLWSTGSIAMVFFSFLGWLAIIFLTVSWVRYVSEVSYAYDEPVIGFWVISDVTMLVMLVAVFYNWFGLDAGLVSVALLGGLYFVVVYATLRVVLKLGEG